MSTPKAIILGYINRGAVASDGESVKNQYIISQLEKLGVKMLPLDFYGWRKRPWVMPQALLTLIFKPRTPLILSTNPINIYGVIKAHRLLRSKRKIIYWVIGGSLHERIKSGEFEARYFKGIDQLLVESSIMYDSLREQGFDNVRVLPNFKEVNYLPPLHQQGEKIRFVFLSRVSPYKGVDYIFDAVEMLNGNGYGDRFEVDIYGKVDDDYLSTFEDRENKLENVRYRGVLPMHTREGVDQLAGYDVMLFPTFWPSEGFAGIFIDAAICGLPIIASDWAHNRAFLRDGVDALFVQPKDAHQLAEQMRRVIDGEVDLAAMKRNAQSRAKDYDIDSVVTPQLLKELGLLQATCSASRRG
ncbi:MAG: glycosyltransferase family 4 protein [Muribaculaceae bacterium]|nr:glycosyltransferase family 4 protein [Muribaculaceae bacterium]MDE6321128.1 glycosyltransferase family 4 protein [Muribaculaceae bacterium]